MHNNIHLEITTMLIELCKCIVIHMYVYKLRHIQELDVHIHGAIHHYAVIVDASDNLM